MLYFRTSASVLSVHCTEVSFIWSVLCSDVPLYVCMYVCMHVCVCMYVCMYYVRMYACMHAIMDGCVIIEIILQNTYSPMLQHTYYSQNYAGIIILLWQG